MAEWKNTVEVVGMYDEVEVDNFSELSVLLTALDIVKTANKKVWVKDELEFTIDVTNVDESTPGIPVAPVTVTDELDLDIAEFVPDSLTIDGNQASEPADYTYDPTTGLLTVPFDSMAAGQTHRIVFRVVPAQ